MTGPERVEAEARKARIEALRLRLAAAEAEAAAYYQSRPQTTAEATRARLEQRPA